MWGRCGSGWIGRCPVRFSARTCASASRLCPKEPSYLRILASRDTPSFASVGPGDTWTPRSTLGPCELGAGWGGLGSYPGPPPLFSAKGALGQGPN
eukprot:6421747-Amphidinium_carterae.1